MSSFTLRSAARRSKNRSRTCKEVSNVSALAGEKSAEHGPPNKLNSAAAHARRSVRQLASPSFSYGRIIVRIFNITPASLPNCRHSGVIDHFPQADLLGVISQKPVCGQLPYCGQSIHNQSHSAKFPLTLHTKTNSKLEGNDT